MISIVAKFKVNEGEEEKFLSLVDELGAASRAETMCIEYALHKHTGEPRTYCILEKWHDQNSVDMHNASQHFTTIVPQIIKISQPEIDVYQPL